METVATAHRSSRPKVFYRNGILKIFLEIQRKNIFLRVLSICNFNKKRTAAEKFSWEFCDYFKISILQNICEQLVLCSPETLKSNKNNAEKKKFGGLCSVTFLPLSSLIDKHIENSLVGLVRRKLILYSSKSNSMQCHGYYAVFQSVKPLKRFSFGKLHIMGCKEMLSQKYHLGNVVVSPVNVFFKKNFIFSYF